VDQGVDELPKKIHPTLQEAGRRRVGQAGDRDAGRAARRASLPIAFD
jgi:hypothetical protein